MPTGLDTKPENESFYVFYFILSLYHLKIKNGSLEIVSRSSFQAFIIFMLCYIEQILTFLLYSDITIIIIIMIIIIIIYDKLTLSLFRCADIKYLVDMALERCVCLSYYLEIQMYFYLFSAWE